MFLRLIESDVCVSNCSEYHSLIGSPIVAFVQVKQANRRRIPIVTTRPSRPGPKTKRAIRYATPSATPSLQTFQSMHNGCSNSRTVTAATVKRKSTPDDGISGDCRNICARNLVYASIIRKKKQQRAEGNYICNYPSQ